MILDVLQTPSSPSMPTAQPEEVPASEPMDVKLTAQILKLNQTISAIIDQHGTLDYDNETKYIDISEDNLLLAAYNFLWGAKWDKDTKTLRVYRKAVE